MSVTVRGLPSRSIVIVTGDPGGPVMSDREYSTGRCCSDVLPTAVIRSPTCRPSCLAGDSSNTRAMRSPFGSGCTSIPMPENCEFDTSWKCLYSLGVK